MWTLHMMMMLIRALFTRNTKAYISVRVQHARRNARAR